MLTQLERAKPGLEAELATGKELMRNDSAPSFVQQTVEEVEGRMKLVDDLAKQRIKALKDNMTDWENYESLHGTVMNNLSQIESGAGQSNAGGQEMIQKELQLQKVHKQLEE